MGGRRGKQRLKKIPYPIPVPEWLRWIPNRWVRLKAERRVMHRAEEADRVRYPYRNHPRHKAGCPTCYERAKGK